MNKNKNLLSLAVSSVLMVPSVFAAGYQQSPTLLNDVTAGILPAVEQRLPVVPAVVTPAKKTGEYGGAFRFGFTGANPGWGGLWFITGWENLVIWKPDFSGVTPNIAEEIDVSDDSRSYTFHLREGMKWSDGVDFTADDIMFYIDDILYNKDISPSGAVADWLPESSRIGFKATKIDTYTVKFEFVEPYGTFLYQLASWSGRHITFFPKHYLKEFHKTYNKNIDQLVAADQNAESWAALFENQAAGPVSDIQNFYGMTDRPLLFPWVPTKALEGGTTITLERNPYYFKVDTQGNQLPYIDTIVGYSYQDGESRTFDMLNGKLDLIKDAGSENRVLYYDAMDEGKPIAIGNPVTDGANTNSIHFNRTIDNPLLAKVFSDKNFRIGMSHAINREEIIEITQMGVGEPAQVAPLETSPLYVEKLATQYIEFDIDLANRYLDKALPNKNKKGQRLGDDGKPFTFTFSVANDNSYGTSWVQISELLKGYWEKVGINVIINSISFTQFEVNKKANTFEATLWTGEGGAGITAILDPRNYAPMEYWGLHSNGHFAWRTDATDSTQVEPDKITKKQREKFESVLTASSAEEQIRLMKQVLESNAEQFNIIGISRPPANYQPYNIRVGNIPDNWVDGWIEGVQKIMYPEQWYLKQ